MTDNIRRSNNAAGVFLISAIFALETSVLDHAEPRPATPYVLGLLVVVAVAALAASVRYRLAARK